MTDGTKFVELTLTLNIKKIYRKELLFKLKTLPAVFTQWTTSTGLGINLVKLWKHWILVHTHSYNTQCTWASSSVPQALSLQSPISDHKGNWPNHKCFGKKPQCATIDLIGLPIRQRLRFVACTHGCRKFFMAAGQNHADSNISPCSVIFDIDTIKTLIQLKNFGHSVVLLPPRQIVTGRPLLWHPWLYII